MKKTSEKSHSGQKGKSDRVQNPEPTPKVPGSHFITKEEFSAILDNAKSQHAQYRQIIQKIRKHPPAQLDHMIHALHESAFEKIDCRECALCCITLGPRITDRDIAKISKNLRVKPSAMSSTYLQTDEDGDYIFKSMPCPFLQSDKLCGIYSVRPAACAGYPHTDRPRQVQLLDLLVKNSLICPAAALIAEGLKNAIQ